MSLKRSVSVTSVFRKSGIAKTYAFISIAYPILFFNTKKQMFSKIFFQKKFSPLERRERMLFFTERKAAKELRTYRSIVCAAGSGSVAAMQDGIHARRARVIRQSPPIRRYHTGRRSHGARLAPAGAGFPAAQIPPHGVALQCGALHCDAINFGTTF